MAILPREALPRHAADEYGIIAVPLREAWAERRFVICMRDRQALTLAAAHLLDHLLNAVGGEACESNGDPRIKTL
ncbi:hypothetical protein ACFFYR_23540 [Paraburkholderia dipogonis]|uniref:hypothetical protein n=1 Tax=Paraburkholderia dipogonis TaxID=1211383 RepID=UPI0035E53C0F